MEFTDKELLQLTLLTDIHEALGIKDSFDAAFIRRMALEGNSWAIPHKYSSHFRQSETPAEVKYVMDVLDMWELLELSIADLSDDERAQLDLTAGDASLPGFDGNNEFELLSIARVLTDDLGKWAHFKGRIHNSHMPTDGLYQRMLEEKDKQIDLYNPGLLNLDQIQAILRARVHPSNR
ncbi:YfbU family protein [Pseudomonas putida]|nr:YfbU family protein [Pseudomonas putida]